MCQSLEDIARLAAVEKTDAGYLEQMSRRALAKFSTDALMQKLLTAATDSPLRGQYEETQRCTAEMLETADHIRAVNYCRKRHCIVCNRIRTAQLISAYLRPLFDLPDPHFVTLTRPNVPAADLANELDHYTKTFTQMTNWAMRKKSGLEKLVGVRKLEITYNAARADYHPHFHVICGSATQAFQLVAEWLKRNPTAKSAAQHSTKANPAAVKELFKYFTKLTVKTKSGHEYHPAAIDTMLNALAGVRTVQPFGGLKALPVDEKLNADSLKSLWAQADNYWRWNQEAADWQGAELYRSQDANLSFVPIVDSLLEYLEKQAAARKKQPSPQTLELQKQREAQARALADKLKTLNRPLTDLEKDFLTRLGQAVSDNALEAFFALQTEIPF